MAERSEKFDWFKGKQSEKKSKKDIAKGSWKWTKVFLITSLFAVSMTGCVQSMVISTDTTIGTGFELYTSEREISPRITTLAFSKVENMNSALFTSDREGTIDIDDMDTFPSEPHDWDWDNNDKEGQITSFNDMYAIHAVEDTTWLSHQEDQEILDELHDSVQHRQNTNMSDSWRGANMGTALTFAGAYDAADGHKLIEKEGADESADYMLLNRGATTSSIAPNFVSNMFESPLMHFGTNTDDQMAILASSGEYASGWDTENEWSGSNPFSKTVPNITSKYVWLPTGADEDMNDRPTYEQFTFEFALNDEPLAPGGEYENDEQGLLRAYYAFSSMSTFLQQSMFQGFSLEYSSNTNETRVDKRNPYATMYYEQDEDDESAVTWHNPMQVLKVNSFTTLMNYYGFSYVYTDTEKDGKEVLMDSVPEDLERYEFQEFRYKNGWMPGIGYGETNYRPVVTWAQAWKLGPFYGLFVYPLGKISSAMLSAFPLMGGWEALLAIVIIVFTVRIFSFAITFKSTMQQTKMQELAAKKANIDLKYEKYKGNKQMENRQRQEVQEMYKKEGINPLSSLGGAFITMPFFLAIWRIISGVQHLKSVVWLGIVFSATSYQELLAGAWQYLPLILVAALMQLASQLYPRYLTKKRNAHRVNAQQKEQMKKNNKQQNIMSAVFVFMAVIFSAGVQIYWIVGGLWRLIESKITHNMLVAKSRKDRGKGKSSKSSSEKTKFKKAKVVKTSEHREMLKKAKKKA